METVTLCNGWTVQFPVELDGGGVEQRVMFAKKLGLQKKKYINGLEWCAGMGIIGYDMMARGLCQNMAFIDKHLPAVNNLTYTSKFNDIRKRVDVYHSDSISIIPKDKKFDLVVSNPPHTHSRKIWEKLVRESFTRTKQEPWSSELFDNWARLIIDENWNTHIDFFKHITYYLAEDADMFICENGEYEFLENLFKQDFRIVSKDAFPQLGPDGLLYHLKVK